MTWVLSRPRGLRALAPLVGRVEACGGGGCFLGCGLVGGPLAGAGVGCVLGAVAGIWVNAGTRCLFTASDVSLELVLLLSLAASAFGHIFV